MRRVVTALVLVCALGLGVATPAGAEPPESARGRFEGVVGGNGAIQLVSFNAHVTGNGRAGGHFKETIAVPNGVRLELRATIICVSVHENRAAVGFRITQASDPVFGYFEAGMVGTMIVEDNGRHGDLYGFGGIGFDVSVDCHSSALATVPLFSISDGNITIRDGVSGAQGHRPSRA